MVKHTNKKIKWAVHQMVTGKITTTVAHIHNVSQRRIQQLVKIVIDLWNYPQLKMNRRPKTHLTDKQKEIIKKPYRESHLGARLLRHHIKRYYGVSIPQNKIHSYLIKKRYARPDPKKQN